MKEFSEEDIELIESWLDGKLNDDEATSFETRLTSDHDFKQQVETLSELRKGIEQAGRKELRSEIKQWEEKEPAFEERVISIWRQPWVTGIAAVLVVGVLAFIFWPKPTVEPQELFAKYFEPYPNVIMPSVRGDISTDSSLMTKGFRAYDRGEYEEAIEFFEQTGVKDEGVLLYLGNSYLAIGEAEKAIPLLETLIREYDVFDEQAEWYLAMGYLKFDDEKAARQLLRKIIEGGGSYAGKARNVLNHKL